MSRTKMIHLTGPADYPCWWWKLAKDGETVPVSVLGVIIPATVTDAERKYAAILEAEIAHGG